MSARRAAPQLQGAALLVGALAFGASGAAHAQTSRADPTDVQAWYAASLQLNLPNRWQTEFQYRLRMDDNASSYRGSFLTGELGYGFTKHLTLLSAYRLSSVEDGTYHRIAGGGELSGDVAGYGVGFRAMLQYQRRNFAGNDEQGSDDRTLLRTRFQLKHDVGRALSMYASSEPYLRFGGGYAVDNWRNTLGVKYEYAKGKKVDLFYVYRPDYGKSYNRTFHVVGVNLDFKYKLGGGKKAKRSVP